MSSYLLDTTLATAQATLAEVSGNTSPERVAELAWDAVSTKCPRPNLPTPSYFIASVLKAVGSFARIDLKIYEYRASAPPTLKQWVLSEADQLNGHQWSGESDLSVTSDRLVKRSSRRIPGDDVETWTSWEPSLVNPSIMLRKVNNQWTVSLSANDSIASFLLDDGKASNKNPNAPYVLVTWKKLSCAQLTSDAPLSFISGN